MTQVELRLPAGTPGATNDSGPGTMTFYYTNQQSARLMFYHDHAVGITRLNVYAGVAAGYLIHDPVEDNLITRGVIPNQGGGVYNWGIPLIIQDKSFVPLDVTSVQDTKWNLSWGDTAIFISPISMSRTRTWLTHPG